MYLDKTLFNRLPSGTKVIVIDGEGSRMTLEIWSGENNDLFPCALVTDDNGHTELVYDLNRLTGPLRVLDVHAAGTSQMIATAVRIVDHKRAALSLACACEWDWGERYLPGGLPVEDSRPQAFNLICPIHHDQAMTRITMVDN